MHLFKFIYRSYIYKFPVLTDRILPWTRFFRNVHLFRVPRSWTGSVQMKSSMTFIRGKRCIERASLFQKPRSKTFKGVGTIALTWLYPSKFHLFIFNNKMNDFHKSCNNKDNDFIESLESICRMNLILSQCIGYLYFGQTLLQRNNPFVIIMFESENLESQRPHFWTKDNLLRSNL